MFCSRSYKLIGEKFLLSCRELLTRSSLEHHKLDLMAEVSHLKMRLAAADKDRRDADDRFRALQRQVTELEAKLLMKDAENSELRLRLGRNGTLPMADGSDIEVEKLKRAVDALMASNEEKERKLEDMRRLLKRYRRVEEILVQAQGRKAVEELLMNVEDGDTSSNSSSTTPSVGDTSLRDQQHSQLHPDDRPDRHYISSPSATSTPVHQMSSSMNGGTAVASIPATSRQAMGMQRSNSCENLVPGSKAKSSSFHKKGDDGGLSPGGSSSGGSSKRSIGGYGTLPKLQQPQSHHHQYQHHNHSGYSSHNRSGSSSGSKEELRVEIRSGSAGAEGGSSSKKLRGFHGLGKTLMRVRSGKRSSSAPNLGDHLADSGRTASMGDSPCKCYAGEAWHEAASRLFNFLSILWKIFLTYFQHLHAWT
ncbi:hypothetical protein RRG08_042958 [Elysia crispata]|uniref:Liprin-beta-1/2 coiled-coil domain-containing protein n=1 Tax=Elysia crispata TaxID=231223 RepID=A0AAE1AYD6_9GAST|nr:hypothetical protein RRG08_042958 [Elysia crispata]